MGKGAGIEVQADAPTCEELQLLLEKTVDAFARAEGSTGFWRNPGRAKSDTKTATCHTFQDPFLAKSFLGKGVDASPGHLPHRINF